MKWSKLVRKVAKEIVTRLPSDLRHKVIRNLMRVPSGETAKYHVKVADTLEELSQAFELLHDQYVSSGFMDSHKSGKRFTFYHALPTTTVVVAKLGDRVVGTCSIITSNSYGLPLEKVFDVSDLKMGNRRLAEISSLAVDPSVDRRQGEINFPLSAFAFSYAVKVLTIDTVVLTCGPAWVDLYQALYGFRMLENNIQDVEYDFVNGKAAFGLYLNAADIQNILYKFYSSKEKNNNLFRYYQNMVNLDGEKVYENYFTYHRPSMKVEALKSFFDQHPEFFYGLSGYEKQILYSYFQDFKLVSEMFTDLEISRKRRVQRFSARCEAIRVSEGGEPYGRPFYLRNASLLGFSCDSHGPCIEGMKVNYSVRVGPFFIANITAKVIKVSEDINTCEIIASDEHWKNFIDAQYASVADKKEESINKLEALTRLSLNKVI